jgi:hypothetical protein
MLGMSELTEIVQAVQNLEADQTVLDSEGPKEGGLVTLCTRTLAMYQDKGVTRCALHPAGTAVA